MKLTRIVGQNCFPPKQDVVVVQTAFSHIKIRTKFGVRPLWDTKRIDGRNSPALVEAIRCFQQMENIPVTGKIEPSGRCIAILKRRLPSQFRVQLAQAGEVASALTSFKGRLLRPINGLFASNQLFVFLIAWENFVPLADQDPDGNCTIGYGHLINHGPCAGNSSLENKYREGISLPDAESLLRDDVAIAESKVKRWLGDSKLTQAMFDALVTLTFNTGGNSQWKVYAQTKSGNFGAAANEFLDINKAKGSVMTGLTRRRKAEYNMYLNSDYSGRP